MDQVSKVREKVDIVSLIQQFIPLKKMGQNFKTNCPFHGEKTPSFVVSPERQIWHCFGCGKGGDCFTFLMEYEHMEFAEALRTLADKVGIRLENQHYDSATMSKKEKIYALNHLAAEFYHYLLTKHEVGKNALAYVEGRGIKPQTLKTYQLGFAPTSGNALVSYLIKKKHYTKEDLLEAGLATPRGREIVDFFQGRLMFPLLDHRDNIIGFSGRVLNNTEKTSKYINTRETLVYHKGYTFFGLNSAKNSIKKENCAIIMEGEFDVISSFQEGITNAVAVKGTALTQDQVNLLSRFCNKVALCFDGDSAGQEALKRSVAILEKKSMTTTVIVLSGGKDPDEIIKTDPIIFKKSVKADVGVYDYLLENAAKKYGTSDSLAKKQIGDEMLPLLSVIDNEIIKEHYLQLLSRTIGTSYDALLKALDKLQKREVIKKEVPLPREMQSREERLEQYLVALVVQHIQPYTLFKEVQDFLNDYTWQVPSYGKICNFLQTFFASHPGSNIKDALPGLPQELLSYFDTCFLLPLPALADSTQWLSEVQKITKELFLLHLRSKMKSLSEGIKQKEKDGDSQELARLQADFAHITQLLTKK